MATVILGNKENLETDISIKKIITDNECFNLSVCPRNSERTEGIFEAGFGGYQMTSSCIYAPIERPAMTELPQMASLLENVRMPIWIKGFEPLVPRK